MQTASDFTPAQTKDLKVLIAFIRLYCNAKHARQAAVAVPPQLAYVWPKNLRLCQECAALLGHAMERRRSCPLDPKPACKKCRIHCYSREYRAKMREIMAWSGRRMLLRGRLDYLWHFF